MNWNSGSPTESGHYWVKGIEGTDPARIFGAQVAQVSGRIELFVQELERVVSPKEVRQCHYAPVLKGPNVF